MTADLVDARPPGVHDHVDTVGVTMLVSIALLLAQAQTPAVPSWTVDTPPFFDFVSSAPLEDIEACLTGLTVSEIDRVHRITGTASSAIYVSDKPDRGRIGRIDLRLAPGGTHVRSWALSQTTRECAGTKVTASSRRTPSHPLQ